VYFNQMQKKAAPPPKAVDPKNPAAAQSDKPKIDTVFCYPAPADAADDRRDEYVTYNQVESDKSGAVVKAQRLYAAELKLEARVQDAAGGEPYQSVKAFGPGEVRVWQLGDKDLDGGPAPNAKPPAQSMGPMQPGAKPAPAKGEQEMKLTIVNFRGRMTAVDKGKVFQQATFTDNVEVFNVPADSIDLKLDGKLLPPRGMLLTCNKELVVWSHKKPDAQPVQRMDATGNAFLRTEEYEGWAETISNDAGLVVLVGSETLPARIKNRSNRGNDQSGKKIIYNRVNHSFRVIGSFGGELGTPKK
jgi:hypothetical protein